MTLSLGYGKSSQSIRLPEERAVTVLEPAPVQTPRRGVDAVRYALENPIGAPRLAELVRPGEKIALVTSDITRPMPSALVLPVVLDELEAIGVSLSDVTVVLALGSHRGHTEEERRRLVGEGVLARVKVEDSDAHDFVDLGHTSAGTPVQIARTVAEAKRRILLGNLEYHYFAGYSGGVKALFPGVSTRAAIQHNHRRMTLPGATTGVADGNPVRADLEEVLERCPVDFILNVILDEHKQLVDAVAGDCILAHRVGCRRLDALYSLPIPHKFPLVIASQGGAPKDLNLYQLQKALDNAAKAVANGGIILLCGECADGLGDETFARWMTGALSPEEIVRRIGENFVLGGHKAAAIAMVEQRAEIWLVSALPAETARRCFFTPFENAQQALDAALEKLPAEAPILVMPYAGSTLPICR